MKHQQIHREFYDAFQTGEFDRFDAIVSADVVTNSSASFGNKGIQALKHWVAAFITAFSPRIDLVDEISSVDGNGNGRAVATVNLNWCHVDDFFGLSPTGREGTSIENLILTIRDHMIVRIEVADTSMDLVFYLRDRGWPFPHNLRPEPIIRGIEREQTRPPVDLRPA